MAMTPSEKQRAYRARLKQAEKTSHDETADVIAGSFAAYVATDDEAHELDFLNDTFDSVGLQFPDLSKDEDPDWREEWTRIGGLIERGSLGKAQRMVGALVDSADALARIINRFKVREIEAAITKAGTADMSDPAERSKAVAEMVRLESLKVRLLKEVRRSFPVTTLRGGAGTI
ncbi:hypothetical protein G3T14_20275 [Methylobacterium sp. BTF04]|uniref:hypothetical protein n=1 Tax=Methylobacterium sp. BTF04 TaxID=2708300 RepID=UPI0013D0E751|nr:hypothetical protein [Methylobacterium sp. BTF04]NEU14443.1 hypothetical protein [Methylobacterium sp. BTF04]